MAPPEGSTATLHIRRDVHPFRDRFRAYRVIVDGEKVGRLGYGESKDFPVDAGTHSLRIAIDWTGSPELSFHVDGDDEARFVCGPSGPAWRWFQQLGRQGWLRLAPDSEPEPGTPV